MAFRAGDSTAVKVYCRIKPFDDVSNTCISHVDDSTLLVKTTRNNNEKETLHTFSHIFSPECSQGVVFSKSVMPLIKSVLTGEDALLFTYGVTGSGKTYTMQGGIADPGILPRSLDVIFNSVKAYQAPKYMVKPDGQNGFILRSEAEAIMDRQRFDYSLGCKTPNRHDQNANLENRYQQVDVLTVSKKSSYAIFISFIELYNDNIHDLLHISSGNNTLPRTHILREDLNHNMFALGVSVVEVKSANEALKAFYRGERRRHVGETFLNKESSRSHTIFTIRVVRTAYDSYYDEVVQDDSLLSVSQFCLVDLAGSERSNRSGASGSRLREASKINKSLMNLRKCIDVLRANQLASSKLDSGGLGVCQSTTRVVPYRDTKLTHLFKSFFEGNGQVVTMICIHPTIEEIDETIHVLKFAEQSQQVSTVSIPNTPRRNCSNSSSFDSGLEVENDKLLSATARLEAGDASLLDCIMKIILSTEQKFDPLSANTIDANPFICCPSFEVSAPDPDRELTSSDPESHQRHYNTRRSHPPRTSLTMAVRHREFGCPLVDILDRRKRERDEMGATLLRIKTRLQTDLSDFLTRTDARNANQEFLLESVDSMTAENHHLRSKIRRLEIASRFREEQEQPQRLGAQLPRTRGKVAEISRQFELRLGDGKRSKLTGEQAPVTTPVGRLRTKALPPTSLNPLANVLNRPAAFNPRHRRSKSAGAAAVWLEHKEACAAPLGTVLTPSIKARKSASQIELEDTLEATNYLLHHQTTDTKGNVETKLFKGSIIPTAGGGSAVVFNDVEELRQTSPLGTERQFRQLDSGFLTNGDCMDAAAAAADCNDMNNENLAPATKRCTLSGRLRRNSSRRTSLEKEEDDLKSEASSYSSVSPPLQTAVFRSRRQSRHA